MRLMICGLWYRVYFLSHFPLSCSDLNSSSTLASSEGESDAKNEDTLSSLDNPLPDGRDQIQQDGGQTRSAVVKAAGGGTATGSRTKQTLPLDSEITTINLRLALPGVAQPVEVMVCKQPT